MSSLKLKHSGGNSVSIAAPSSNPAANRTITVPSTADGTMLTTTNPKAGNILQVVQGGSNAVSSASVNAASIWESTGIDVTITPAHANNKILLMASIHAHCTGPQNNHGVILRKGTGGSYSTLTAANAATSGNIMTLIAAATGVNAYDVSGLSFNYLDTAGSTNATTYKCDLFNPSSITRTVYVNRGASEADEGYYARAASWIIAMEVAA
jgi:glutamate 5-kinase